MSEEEKTELRKGLGITTAPETKDPTKDLEDFLEVLEKGNAGFGAEFEPARTAAEVDISGALPKMVESLEKSHRAIHGHQETLQKGMAAMMRHQIEANKSFDARMAALEAMFGAPQARKSLTGAPALAAPDAHAQQQPGAQQPGAQPKRLIPARLFVSAVLDEARKSQTGHGTISADQLRKARSFIAQAETARVVEPGWFTQFGLPVPAAA
jgi:non-ribosomal peptide synthetase component F